MLTFPKWFGKSSGHFWNVSQAIILAKTRNSRRAKSEVHEKIGEFSFITSFASDMISCKRNYTFETYETSLFVWNHVSKRENGNIFNSINADSSEMLHAWTLFSFHSLNTSSLNCLATNKRFISRLKIQQIWPGRSPGTFHLCAYWQ